MWMMGQVSPFPSPGLPCPCRANALLEGSQKSALRSSECKVLLAVSCHHDADMLDTDSVLVGS